MKASHWKGVSISTETETSYTKEREEGRLEKKKEKVSLERA